MSTLLQSFAVVQQDSHISKVIPVHSWRLSSSSKLNCQGLSMEFKSELFYLLFWRWFTMRDVCLVLLSCWKIKQRPRPSFAADCFRVPDFPDSFHFDDIHSSRRSEASLQISTLVIVCHCGDCVLSPNISSVSMASSLWPKDGLPVCIVFLQVVFSVSQSDLKVSAQFPLLCFLCRVQVTVFLEITIVTVTVLLASLVCRQLFWDLWMHLSLVFYFLPL